jgi:UDPglucose 6-dehydrogenase
MKLCVVGTGYVGLVAGAGFADMGNDVSCVDIDPSKIEKLNGGELPIYEPGLEPLVARNKAEGRLTFTTDVAEGVRDAEMVFLAPGTPQGESGEADLSALFAAAENVARALTRPILLVTKSTVPVGTGDRLRQRIQGIAKHPVVVCSNPEFLKEGNAVNDFLRPERVIIGTDDPQAAEKLRYLYGPFTRTGDRFIEMSLRSAEVTKYAANAMLATRISFMNQIAGLCERVGADVEDVRKGIGSDSRIGARFLFAGAGYGGSCFPKDLRALLHTGRECGASLDVVEAVERANERQKLVLFEKLAAYFKASGGLDGKRIAVWGLAFKPGTDDVREAPALHLVRRLVDAGAVVTAHDPVAHDMFAQMLGALPNVSYAATAYDAVAGADALALVTEWGEYRRPAFDRIAAMMLGRAVFDGRNIWSPEEVERYGFSYHGIGRGRSRSA